LNRDAFAARFYVSCETMERLDAYVALLQKWSNAINLLGPIETEHLWERHISDCGQLIAHIPQHARTWLDIGTGAGLPGLVLAILADIPYPNLAFTLLDADMRKAAFLREAGRQTGTNVEVLSERTENAVPRAYDVVSARAFAPLRRLLGHVDLVAPGSGTLLLLKGRNVEKEIDDAGQEWEIEASLLPSLTDPEGRILTISSFTKRP